MRKLLILFTIGCILVSGMSACSTEEQIPPQSDGNSSKAESPNSYLSFFSGDKQLYLGMSRAEADELLGECESESGVTTHHGFYVVSDWYNDKAVGISMINSASDWISGFGIGIGSSLDDVEKALGNLPLETANNDHYRVYYFTLKDGKPVAPERTDTPGVFRIGVNIDYTSPTVMDIWLMDNRREELVSLAYMEQERIRREEATPADMGPWEHTGYQSQDEFHKALEDWVDAYRSGEYAQIYIDGPGEGMFHTWRLTCNGTQKYIIENRSWGSDSIIYGWYSEMVFEGVVQYTFGKDADGDYLPITLFKDAEEMQPLGQDTDEWNRQKSISVSQAEVLAKAMMSLTYSYANSNLSYSVNDRFCMMGQWFYGLNEYGPDGHYAGQVAVSADGTAFMVMSMVDGSWYYVRDLAERRILPGENKLNLEELLMLRRGENKALTATEEMLIGSWHGADTAEDPYADRYLFRSNGIYIFAESMRSPDIERRFSAGNWWIEDGMLHLSASKILNRSHAGQELVQFWWGFDLKKLIEDGTYDYVRRAENERQISTYPITIVNEDNAKPFSIKIGEYQLWHLDIRLDDMLTFYAHE